MALELSEGEFMDWWTSPIALEVRRAWQKYLIKLNDTALSETIIRDPVQGAICLGRKRAITEFLAMDYAGILTETAS